MTQSPQQPSLLGSLPAELVLSIARDLEEVTDRIADMKALCDRQMADLADAAAAAASIADMLARRRGPAEADPDFATLGLELSLLYKTVEAQVGACQGISKQFLAIAREVEAEFAALRSAAPAPAGGAGIAPSENTAGENVVWLRARRETRADAAAAQAAKDLRLALQAMQDSTCALFRAQTESRKMAASLRRRMREHRRRVRGGGA